MTFSPSGDVLISVSDDATIRFWRVESGECERVLHGHTIDAQIMISYIL
ncbi:MAG: hypothetical protein HS114_30610 [Anaerolineales bacterium]|nr:hypothetical protein [Anaerolineales bacterium]